MFSAFFRSHSVNHSALITVSGTISASLFESLKLCTNACLRATTANSGKINRILKAVFLMRCYELHGLSPCYEVNHKVFAESCNRK